MMPRNFYKKISKGFESNVIDMTGLNIFGLHDPIGNKGLQPCRELLNMRGVNSLHHTLNKSCRIIPFKSLQILFILLSNYRLRCRAPAS